MPKQALKTVIGVLMAWLLLVVAIAAGLRVPDLAYPGDYPAGGRLDATRPSGGFTPLSQRYIDQILGLPAGTVAGPRLPATTAAATDGLGGGAVAVGPISATTQRTVLRHAFTNDDFARAQPIPSIPFTGKTEMHGATRQTGEPTACAPAGGTAWYRYVAPTDGALFADTFGSDFPLTLGVFEGTSLTRLQNLGCNTSATGNAQVGFHAEAHHTYDVQITAATAGGSLVVDLSSLGTTARVSVPSPGGSDNRPNAWNGYELTMTPDGRYVAFTSYEEDLDPRHPGPTDCFSERLGCSQVYVRDRLAHTTELISRSTSGRPGNSASDLPSMSADGRYVAFTSFATNLVPGDTNEVGDVFVHDRRTGVTTRESVTEDGRQLNSDQPHALATFGGQGSIAPHLSADGRYLAFESDATNLGPRGSCSGCELVFVRDRVSGVILPVGADRHGRHRPKPRASQEVGGISADGRYLAFGSTDYSWGNRACGPDGNDSHGCVDQLYRWDLETGRVVWISKAADGRESDAALDMWSIAISRHGDVISFQSPATNLVAGDTNGFEDAFVWRASTRSVVRVSVTSDGGQQLNPDSSGYGGTVEFFAMQQSYTSLSADGRYVAFDSRAANLVPDDTNGASDVFVHDLVTGATIRVSVTSTGGQGDGASSWPVMSADGTTVAFRSAARSLGATHLQGDVFVHVRPAGGI